MSKNIRRVYYVTPDGQGETFLAEGSDSDAELIASAIAEAEVGGIIYPPGSDVGPTRSQLTAGLKIIPAAPSQTVYRCTRQRPYSNPGCPGHNDTRARQGYYVVACSASCAFEVMAADYEGESDFTVEVAHPAGPPGEPCEHCGCTA